MWLIPATLEAEAQVASAEQKVQAAASRLQAAKANLDHKYALFAYTRIVSPFNGIVTQRYASDGAMIQAGTSSSTQAMPVVHVAQDDVLRLMLPVPEAEAGTIKDGQQVSVTVPALHKSIAGENHAICRTSADVDAHDDRRSRHKKHPARPDSRNVCTGATDPCPRPANDCGPNRGPRWRGEREQGPRDRCAGNCAYAQCRHWNPDS